MTRAPERIWTNFREANRLYIAYDEPPRHPDDDCKDAYILVTAHEAAVAAARAEGMREAAKPQHAYKVGVAVGKAAELAAAQQREAGLTDAVERLVVVLDRNDKKGPIPDVEMMFCWLAAQDIRAAFRAALSHNGRKGE